MKPWFSPFPWSDLLRWYEKAWRHDLEWRDYSMDEKVRSYRVWLSEICLQQTQVERVRGYFNRILEAYPTVGDLARASYEEFYQYYQWLGYYSRARNMLRTAEIVSQEYEWEFPIDIKLLEKLPGVWWYTARAVMAFAFGEPYLAWDTNLEKVFSRYYNGDKNIKLTEEEKTKIEEDFRNFVSWRSETVRAINNALMDFAATVDLKNPSNIDWENYPIKNGKWYETRWSLEIVETKKSETFPVPDASLVVMLHRDHRIYYSPRESTIDMKTWKDISEKVHIPKLSDEYRPFLLSPALQRDTRKYVQEYFRDTYGLELSVRPVQKKWLSEGGKPYIAVNAQVQVGDVGELREWKK